MKNVAIEEALKTLLPSSVADKQSTGAQDETFFDALKNALGEVNKLHQEADRAVQELASGEGRDIHSTMIALEKAEISFQLMMQIRNKIISAYETIMHMNI